MSRRRRVGLLFVALLALALAVRALPLYWSPLPSTLDGINYAALARTTLETGSLPFTDRADSLFFTTLIAVLGAVFEAPPLRIAQPLATAVGTVICLAGAVIARRVVDDAATVSVRSSTVAVVTLGLLAVEGLFLRRTSVPDEEIVGILLALLVAFALHYAFRTGRRRWFAVVALLLGAFPLLHTFTSFVVGLVVTALAARHVSRTLSLRALVGGVALAGGFWLYVAAYYRAAETSLSLSVPYVDRVTAYPGLFVAWVIVLVVGAVWIQHTSLRVRQGTYLAVVGSFFAVVALNALTPIFPGTARTPQVVLRLVLLLAVVAFAAAASLHLLDSYRGGALLVALFAAPAAIIGFSLTAALTPEYFATAMRAQTFLHPPVLALGAVTVAALLERDSPDARGAHSDGRRSVRRSRTVRIAIVALVVAATAASAPLAYVNMDTGSAPSTTLDSEHEGVAFVSTHRTDGWASDHSLTRVGEYLFETDPSMTPVADWLSGGPAPTCTVVSQESWTTTGAHLFPSAPETVSPSAYERWLTSRNVIYASNGLDPVTVSVPVGERGSC